MEVSGIQTDIERDAPFTGVLYEIINSVNLAVTAMYNTTAAIIALNEALSSQSSPIEVPPVAGDSGGPAPPGGSPASAGASAQWETGGVEVFTGSGADRYWQEVQSANSMLEQLGNTQNAIAQQAYNTSIFPTETFLNLNSLAVRIDTIRERIEQIEQNPVNFGSDTANGQLEQMRSQLADMLQQQNELNGAVQNMDVSAANEAYLRLAQSVGRTEQYIRDNADEQGVFNGRIQEGASSMEGLKKGISKVVGVLSEKFGLSEIIDFVSEGMDAFNAQLNAEIQLMSALAKEMDDAQVSDYLLETRVAADTSGAASDIDSMQRAAGAVEITPEARTEALQAEFDAIVARADELSSKGVYGGDTLTAGAAELSKYFTDTDAVEMMMGTLADYAMGMEAGVGEIDTSTMVNYAASLGKIMSGSYSAMAENGFEFTDAQKAIIDGTAEEQQIVAALGKEYLGMSQDMQAAAVIAQVIGGSCAGVYETMSNTPQGKLMQLTSAWGEMKTMVAGQLYPYILLFVDTIRGNWGTIQTVIGQFAAGLQNVMAVLCWLLEGAMNFASMIAENWSIISPIVYGIAAALAVYAGYLGLIKVAELAGIVVKGVMAAAGFIYAAALSVQTGATIAAIAQQKRLNGAMFACPVVSIIILFIALIAILFAVCNAIAKMTQSADSGFGVMTGGINVVIQFFKNLGLAVANIGLGIGNAMVAVAGNMMIAFHNAIRSVQSWFYRLLSTALTVVAGICEALNGLPFVDFDYSGLTSAALDYADKAAEADGDKEEYQSVIDAFNEGFQTFETFQEGWIADAYNAGADWGDGIAERAKNFDLKDILELDIGSEKDYEVSAEDYASMLGSSVVGSGVDDIAENTGAVRDSLEVNTEELKYLRDLAERDIVNRFTTAEIKVDMSGMQNTVNSGDDIDGFMTRLTDSVNEAVDNMTEGVHQ